VPIHPELVTMLREHLEECGTGPHGRLFTGPRSAIITDRAYLKVFNEARSQALTAQEASCSAPFFLDPWKRTGVVQVSMPIRVPGGQ